MLSLGFAVGRAGRTCMRSLSASSKGKAAGGGEGARTGALPFPSRGRLARVATLAMAGWAGLAGAFGGLLGEKAGVSRKLGRQRSKCAFFGLRNSRVANTRPKVGRGKSKEKVGSHWPNFMIRGWERKQPRANRCARTSRKSVLSGAGGAPTYCYRIATVHDPRLYLFTYEKQIQAINLVF